MRLLAQLAVATALLATIASTLRVYPHQLAYFNEAAGGPENGHEHLLHSNVDWGQDLFFARELMRRSLIRPDEVRVESNSPYPAVRFVSNASEASTPKWIVVSTNNVLMPDSPYRHRFLDDCTCRVGYSLWLFQPE